MPTASAKVSGAIVHRATTPATGIRATSPIVLQRLPCVQPGARRGHREPRARRSRVAVTRCNRRTIARDCGVGWAVRSSRWIACLALIAGCRPSATIEQTTPIANLQTHRSVAIRVTSSAFASQGRAMFLENAVMTNLRQRCGFERIDRASGQPADLVLDINITHVGRGGGFVSNQNQATIDALLVVSDGQSGDLLGASKIRGKSSGMLVNNTDPENQAIDIMARTLADVFVKSGCAGPRVARVDQAPVPPGDGGNAGSAAPDPGTGGPAQPDDARRAEAEALNEQGKEKLRGGDPAGALATFRVAAERMPDPRYVFNICLTHQALEQLDNAIAECKRARGMNPDARLAAKIDQRLQLLADAKR